jgi:hypothetical protein
VCKREEKRVKSEVRRRRGSVTLTKAKENSMKSNIKYYVVNNILDASGQWPTTKIGALQESIRKWKFISKHPGVCDGAGSTCACCQLFINACGNCLVAEGGYTGCRGTPYGSYVSNPTAENARKEVRFLQGILKANSPKADIKGK